MASVTLDFKNVIMPDAVPFCKLRIGDVGVERRLTSARAVRLLRFSGPAFVCRQCAEKCCAEVCVDIAHVGSMQLYADQSQ